MARSISKTAILIGVMMWSSAEGQAAVAFQTGQNANVVIGQADFSASAVGGGSTGLHSPSDVVIAPSGKLFIADGLNNRVLRYSSASALASGAAPEFVFGQPNLTAVAPGLSAKDISNPEGICLDLAGNLWVGDCNNNRVLRFANAATVTTAYPSAAQVLGQADFTHNTAQTTSSGMDSPSGLAVDDYGTGWLAVADTHNNRVLIFNASSGVNGPSVLYVYGQPTTTDHTARTIQHGMSSPIGIFFDLQHNLWVADANNNRILRFDFTSPANNPDAEAVFGRPDFTSAGSGNADPVTAANLFSPQHLVVTHQGNLYVADALHDRVLEYLDASSQVGIGAPAAIALGQASLTSDSSSSGVNRLDVPFAVAFDSFHSADGDDAGSLYVADAGNNRILRFSPVAVPVSQLTLALKKKRVVTTKKQYVIRGTASDSSGTTPVVFVQTGSKQGRLATGGFNWHFKARLQPGRNLFNIFADDPANLSSVTYRMVIIRK